ncbi:MAG TPA: FecR domain-containing protein [Pyrinomonadaceae bacterium]|nr:FecR domain-containing protein [Pyrinomonadaceae bacterium]
MLKITYRVNDELLAGDVVKTGVGGRLVLGLLDGSQAIIGEKTIVEIADLSKSPRTIFNVLRGKTRIKIEKVGGRPNPYRVNTPTTVIAVRGTLFDVIVSDKETQVFVHEGEVAVSNFAKPEWVVILSPGQRTRVQQTQPPEPPSHFQPGRNNNQFKPDQRERGPNDDPRQETRTDQRGDDREQRDGNRDQTSQDGDGPDAGQSRDGQGSQPSVKHGSGGGKDGGKKP